MPGKTVLLTRPAPDSRDVARRLTEHGVDSAIWPLTEIVPLGGRVQVPKGTEALIFTSRNAVTAFAELSDRRDLAAWCVGQRTADAAHNAGFARVHAGDGDVTGLVARLRSLPGGQVRRMLYLRGRVVSADLHTLLADTPISLESHVIYAAEPTGPPDPPIRDALASGAIGVIGIWSQRAAEVLAGQLAAHSAWDTGSLIVVAISERATEPLRTLGFAHICVSTEPTGQAMEAAILAAVRQKGG